jgi:hypothetical protein
VGRTLLSDAFDVGLDFDLDREGHGLSRAVKRPKKLTRLQPLRYALAVVPRNGERPVCPQFIPRLPTKDLCISPAVNRPMQFDCDIGNVPSVPGLFDVGLDFDLDREGHGLSRAVKRPKKLTRLQPLRYALAVVPRNGERPVCPRFSSDARDLGVAPARVGRTLLSDALDVGLDFDLDREGHGLSRAVNRPKKLTRLQPLRYALAVVPRNGEPPVCPRFISNIPTSLTILPCASPGAGRFDFQTYTPICIAG